MKRRFALIPLMAVTALSLTLAACDENGAADETAQATGESSMPAADATAAPETQEQKTVMHADGATSFATAEGVRTGVVFVRLHNPNAAADTLVGAKSDKATMVELHQSFVDETDGTMQMRKVSGVEIPANGEVTLNPGGYHIMLIDLLSPLVEGETFNVTLQFQNAGELVVPVTVTAPGASMDSTHNHSAAPGSDANGTTGATEGGSMPMTTTDEPMPAETGADVPADAPVSETPAEETPANDGTVAP